jgi:pilus assembly protein CpaB
MGRWRAVIPIVLALIVALTASVFLYKWMKKQVAPKKEAKEKIKTVQVVVAEVNLPPGTKLKREMLTTARFLEVSLPPGYKKNPAKLVGRIVMERLKKKELVLESKLAPTSVKTGGLAAIVTPGKRAVTVKGDNVLGVSGFVRPGCHVDILLTTKHPKSKAQINKVVFENVRVLATGKQLGLDPKSRTSSVKSYTLEVTPEEAERLAICEKQGKFQFALRNVTDTKTVLTTGATLGDALAYYRPIVPTDRHKPKPVRITGRPVTGRGYSVEIIKGLKRTRKQY